MQRGNEVFRTLEARPSLANFTIKVGEVPPGVEKEQVKEIITRLVKIANAVIEITDPELVPRLRNEINVINSINPEHPARLGAKASTSSNEHKTLLSLNPHLLNRLWYQLMVIQAVVHESMHERHAEVNESMMTLAEMIEDETEEFIMSRVSLAFMEGIAMAGEELVMTELVKILKEAGLTSIDGIEMQTLLIDMQAQHMQGDGEEVTEIGMVDDQPQLQQRKITTDFERKHQDFYGDGYKMFQALLQSGVPYVDAMKYVAVDNRRLSKIGFRTPQYYQFFNQPALLLTYAQEASEEPIVPWPTMPESSANSDKTPSFFKDPVGFFKRALRGKR